MDKLEIIGKHLNEHISVRTLEKEYNADRSMICHWVRDYSKYGEAAFDYKGHPGNPFAALHTSKTLTETEILRLQLIKLEIENERLKKGYQVKGAGANKEFVSLKDVNMKDKYSVKSLCEIMSVNRSGYYKWLARKDKPNRYEQDRIILTELLLEQHNKHKTKGYHYLANLVRNETGWMFSDNLAHKCCKLAGIRSVTNRGRKTVGKENIKFPNTVKGNWNTTKPLEIVVSDMTCIMHKGIRWEWTYLLDVFNNEIIASSVTNKVGSSLPYYHCLKYLIEKKKEQNYPVTLHTDQGIVYSSAGFYQTHKDYTNIKRSMSRAGTPTDNPIIESLNGWIKEEMRTDFNLRDAEGIPSFIEKYVHYFNNERLSYKLHYKTPVQYRIEQGFG